MPNYKTVEGVRLVSSGSHWESEDGEYGVQLEEGTTDCDEPHVMKITRTILEHAQQYPRAAYSQTILFNHRQGKRGYICEGDSHGYPIWTVWVHGHTVDEMAPTFAQALEILAASIRREREKAST